METTDTTLPVTEKRKRKPRVAKPPVERKARAPVVTLLAKIRAMSPTHEKAYRVLKSDAMDEALRAEMEHTTRLGNATARVNRATRELTEARAALAVVESSVWADGDARKTLDTLARQIADAMGEDVTFDPAADVEASTRPTPGRAGTMEE